jgi:hypothetical protein
LQLELVSDALASRLRLIERALLRDDASLLSAGTGGTTHGGDGERSGSWLSPVLSELIDSLSPAAAYLSSSLKDMTPPAAAAAAHKIARAATVARAAAVDAAHSAGQLIESAAHSAGDQVPCGCRVAQSSCMVLKPSHKIPESSLRDIFAPCLQETL